MASVALDPAYRRISVEEFLAMDLGDAKAELEDGLIYMMTGGTSLHASIGGNIFFALRSRLGRGRCRTFGPDLGVRTGERTVRFPDVSVYSRDEWRSSDDQRQLIGDPQLVVEVLSPSTARHDQKTKLGEYQKLEGIREIILVDPRNESIKLFARTGAEADWIEKVVDDHADMPIPSLNLTIERAEIFNAG